MRFSGLFLLIFLFVCVTQANEDTTSSTRCATENCDGHGICVIKDGTPACACNPGYINTDATLLSCVPQSAYYSTPHLWPETLQKELALHPKIDADYPGRNTKSPKIYTLLRNTAERRACAGISCAGGGLCGIRRDGQPECSCDDGFFPEPGKGLNCVSGTVAPTYERIHKKRMKRDELIPLRREEARFNVLKNIFGNTITKNHYMKYRQKHPDEDYLYFLERRFDRKVRHGYALISLGVVLGTAAVPYQFWLFRTIPPGSAYRATKNCDNDSAEGCGGGLLYMFTFCLYALAIAADVGSVLMVILGHKMIRRYKQPLEDARRLTLSKSGDGFRYTGISPFGSDNGQRGLSLNFSF
ncbi:MAG: hypothetical protein JXR76_32125 [Deltaproteobacteria bacterium]|nr:hypothetical protein [Deltaproteobacteria bacterium]